MMFHPFWHCFLSDGLGTFPSDDHVLVYTKDDKKSIYPPKNHHQTSRNPICQELTTASLGLPVWDLVFEDHFDRLTCVPDRNGILRPNPLSWTPEIGSWPRWGCLICCRLSFVSWGGGTFFQQTNGEIAYLIFLGSSWKPPEIRKMILKR